ncbi:MAG: HPF/RaiA family ribosome-associated protein [Lysobacterales bacterium]
MQIVTHALGFALTDALALALRRRLQFAFDHLGAPVRRVVVRLSDVNGTRGGADKRCQLHIQLDRAPDVIVEDVQQDLYVAINRAIERAARTIGRRLGRVRQIGMRTRPEAPLRTQTELSS